MLEDIFDEERYFLLLSVFIGIFSGLAVVCFRLAIDWTHLALLGPVPQAHTWRLVAIPGLAGLAVALLAIHVFPGIGGSGVNQIRLPSTSSMDTFRFARLSENSFAPRWRLEADIPSDPKILLCRSERV